MISVVLASRFLRLESIFMQGPDVSALQKRLQELGYEPGKTDGIFGPTTEKAVISFQSFHHINADGIVGPETWTHLHISPRIQTTLNIYYEKSDFPSICIDIDQRKLRFSSKHFNKTYPVAVGKPATPTPVGNWTIVQKALNPGGAFGVRWMRLSIPWGGYGIHGTNRPSSIGTAASHGCVRMYNADVIEVYEKTPIGTLVNIIGKIYTGRLLQIGCQGEEVKELQKKLKELGYYQASVDGYYGSKTKTAVINFQKDHGLAADGIYGPLTAQALQKAMDIANNDVQP